MFLGGVGVVPPLFPSLAPVCRVLGVRRRQDAEPLYCAEQIKVPAQLPEIMKAWTKEVIRTNPPNIYEFSAKCVGFFFLGRTPPACPVLLATPHALPVRLVKQCAHLVLLRHLVLL